MTDWKKHHLIGLQLSINGWNHPTTIQGRIRETTKTTLDERDITLLYIEPRSNTTINELFVTQVEGYPPVAIVSETKVDHYGALITNHTIIKPETDPEQSTLSDAVDDAERESAN